MNRRLEQVQSDISYIHQTTILALEIRTQAELDRLLEALQGENTRHVVLHDRNRTIDVNIYLRFRE